MPSAQPHGHTPAESIPLIPPADFAKVVKRVFAMPKAESDRELAAFKASNAAKRTKRKRKAK